MPGPYLPYDAVGTLTVTALAVMGTPGPATISLTAAGSAYGARRCLGYLAGIVAGTCVVLLAVAGGVTAAVLAVPAVRPVLIAVAAGYILWLAYHIATAPALPEQAGDVRPPSAAAGALLGVANPKAWVAIAAVFASVHVSAGAAADAAAKVAVLSVLIVAVNATWLLAGAWLAPVLRDPVRARFANPALAALLVAAVVLAVVR
jgi:threonine/homoserine/homoserine lactone efflux protein